MKNLSEHLSQYAYYHQNPSNVATHFVGIPMILIAITVLLAKVSFTIHTFSISLAMVAAILVSLFYLRLDKGLGALMAGILLVCVWFSHYVASLDTVIWLATGLGLFVVGWVFQFIGHYIEGKKPAFVDDIVGLIIGPLFVLVELLFLFGLKKSLQQTIRVSCEEQNRMVQGSGKVQ
ncbi:Mpo1 family 2-hydroxy fatty acid dioxygenase [Marinomonas epiphytica]